MCEVILGIVNSLLSITSSETSKIQNHPDEKYKSFRWIAHFVGTIFSLYHIFTGMDYRNTYCFMERNEP